MLSDKFRRQLRSCAQQWLSEGLIDAQQYQQLSQRYQFARIDIDARNRFIGLLISLGGLLLGIGAITLVAANWQAWSREWKATFLLMLFLSINVGGFYLWRLPGEKPPGREGWQQRLGQGLLLLGALILGANMALMSQMFHRSGSLGGLLIGWGLGVLAMAYSLRVTSLSILAILLIGVGYWPGWHESGETEGFLWLRAIVQHMPLLAAVVFVPLAYWCRSRMVFLLGAIAAVSSLEFNLLFLPLSEPSQQALLLLTFPPAILWSYDDSVCASLVGVPPDSGEKFAPLARSLAVVFLSVLFYILSFHWFWPEETLYFQAAEYDSPVSFLQVVDVMAFSTWTIWAWLRLAFPLGRDRHQPLDLVTGFIASFIAIADLVFLWYLEVSPIPAIATFIFNVLLFLLAYGLIRQGLATSQRRTFWWGIVLLTGQILSRVFEYDTGLLLKALVFFLCGAGVIAIGLWFERYLHTLSQEAVAQTPSEQETL